MIKKISSHILRYIYLILGLIPIVVFLLFIYLSRINPKEYSNVGVIWLRGTDSLLSFNMVSAMGIGCFMGASAFMVFIGKNRWLPLFALACILYICQTVNGLFYICSWSEISRSVIIYLIISVVAVVQYMIKRCTFHPNPELDSKNGV